MCECVCVCVCVCEREREREREYSLGVYTHLDPAGRQQMLSHALHQQLEEEPRVLHELADDELVGVCGQQHCFQVVRKLLVH